MMVYVISSGSSLVFDWEDYSPLTRETGRVALTPAGRGAGQKGT